MIKSQQESSPPEPPNPNPDLQGKIPKAGISLFSNRIRQIPFPAFVGFFGAEHPRGHHAALGALHRVPALPPRLFWGCQRSFPLPGQNLSAFPLSPAGAEPDIPRGGLHTNLQLTTSAKGSHILGPNNPELASQTTAGAGLCQ